MVYDVGHCLSLINELDGRHFTVNVDSTAHEFERLADGKRVLYVTPYN